MRGSVESLQIAFLVLLLVTILLGALANRLNTPYPILLVIAGLLVSLVPAVPRITLNPDVIFFVFLPPPLCAAAVKTSWREFSNALVNILLLAIGLVAFTVLGVAMVACSLFQG